jgi:hypothetical protein
MTDPKPSIKLLLARQTTLTDNLLKPLEDFRAGLEALSERAGELEDLNQQIAAAKTQLATLKAQLSAMWSEFEQMKEAHSKTSAEPRRNTVHRNQNAIERDVGERDDRQNRIGSA